jgi:hypothetical protein
LALGFMFQLSTFFSSHDSGARAMFGQLSLKVLL